MKKLFKITTLFIFLMGTSVMAQNSDQNPNYKESQTKYVAQKEALTKEQGQTIQETYEAYDWTENKLKEKKERIERRHQVRMNRHQRNTICYSSNGYRRNYNNGCYNNGYNSNYNNGYYGNNNWGGNYSNSIASWGSAALTSAVLGTTLYYLLK